MHFRYSQMPVFRVHDDGSGVKYAMADIFHPSLQFYCCAYCSFINMNTLGAREHRILQWDFRAVEKLRKHLMIFLNIISGTSKRLPRWWYSWPIVNWTCLCREYVRTPVFRNPYAHSCGIAGTCRTVAFSDSVDRCRKTMFHRYFTELSSIAIASCWLYFVSAQRLDYKFALKYNVWLITTWVRFKTMVLLRNFICDGGNSENWYGIMRYVRLPVTPCTYDIIASGRNNHYIAESDFSEWENFFLFISQECINRPSLISSPLCWNNCT